MPQTLEDLRQQFGGKWYDFGKAYNRAPNRSGAPEGWMRAPRIDPMAEAVWHPQYGWQRWKDIKRSGGDYSGLTAQFGDPYEIFGMKYAGDPEATKKHGLYRPGPGPGAVMPQPTMPQPVLQQVPGGLPGQQPALPEWEIPGMKGMGMEAQMGSLGPPSRFNYGGGYGVQGRQPYRYPGGGF